MIKASELRLGNYVLQKIMTRVVTVALTYDHFALLANSGEKDFFPIVLKPEIVEKCGFVENKKYPLLPEAREFNLELPVIGNNKIELKIYVKNNGECFGRAHANGQPCSNNFFHLHQLQNVYFSLTWQELEVKVK
jgi:hypothetical protein